MNREGTEGTKGTKGTEGTKGTVREAVPSVSSVAYVPFLLKSEGISMKNTSWIAIAVAMLAFAAGAAEPEDVALEEAAKPSRWRISVGTRFAPGVKTKATISSRAVIDAAGRLWGANAAKNGAPLPSGSSTTTERGSTTTTDESSESVPLTPTTRIDFPDGSFIDMDDTTIDPRETWYWHFNDSAAFDEASGSLAVSSGNSTATSRESSTSRSEGEEVVSSSYRSSLSETVMDDAASSSEDDLWGVDLEVGYDLYRGERFSLGFGIGATYYQDDDAISVAGRCYSATASTARESASGRYATTTETTTDTTEETRETTTFTNPNFAYDGALADIRNDDGSFGGGTRDGQSNPYGGPNPSLILGDGSVTRTTTVETRRDTTVETTRTFEAAGGRSSGGRSSSRRTIDVAATGDVEMWELRAVVQPSWRAAEWLELRGSLGAVATRVEVDTEASLIVNGARAATFSGDDGDWAFAGICGLDAVFAPFNRMEFLLGGDIRLGEKNVDYSAGLLRGSVELARYTFRAAVGFRF